MATSGRGSGVVAWVARLQSRFEPSLHNYGLWFPGNGFSRQRDRVGKTASEFQHDSIEYDVVASLARPCGNATGFTAIIRELMAKRVELLHQLRAVTSIAFLINSTNAASATEEARNAGRILGLQVLMIDAAHQSDIEPAFAEMAQRHELPAIFFAGGCHDGRPYATGRAYRHIGAVS